KWRAQSFKKCKLNNERESCYWSFSDGCWSKKLDIPWEKGGSGTDRAGGHHPGPEAVKKRNSTKPPDKICRSRKMQRSIMPSSWGRVPGAAWPPKYCPRPA